MGDSITYGHGVSRSEVWPAVASKLSDHTFINCGVSGETTGQMKARFKAQVINEKPDFVFIIGGANDFFFIGPHSIYDAQANLADMAFEAREHNIVPILGTNLNVCAETLNDFFKTIVDLNTANPTIIRHRELLKKFCEANKFEYIDFNEILQQASTFDDMRDLIFDGLHPDSKSHAILAKAVAELPLLNNVK